MLFYAWPEAAWDIILQFAMILQISDRYRIGPVPVAAVLHLLHAQSVRVLMVLILP